MCAMVSSAASSSSANQYSAFLNSGQNKRQVIPVAITEMFKYVSFSCKMVYIPVTVENM